MPRQIYIERTFPGGDCYWWPVCTVWDNEALGFIQRQLQAAGFEVRVQEESTGPVETARFTEGT